VAQVKSHTLAGELVALAHALDPLNGEGRSAAVWSLDPGPQLLYAGPHARSEVLGAATERLARGERDFQVEGEPGITGRVFVCSLEGERVAYGLFLHGAGTPHLGTTIDGLVEAAEASIGKPASQMSRSEKQQVVRFLDERGVFLIRKAVESTAERLGVTRFTIYNYLDREAGRRRDTH
jgi:DNA binding protein with HTH domain